MECLNYLSITKPATLIFLGIILLSSTNLPSILSQENEQYIRCRHQFNCGKITRIDYPFWGGDRPEECGYPGLKLDCTNGTTIIQINRVDYRVLDLNQDTQVLKTTRNDLFLNLCTQEFKNATLDTGLFEYVSGYINVTFLYGCPNLNFPLPYQFDCPVKGIRERNGYVEFGMQLFGMCHKSVVVPVSSQSLVNFLDLKEVVRQGFDVRYKVENSGCRECKNSGGSCGYDVAGKQLSCLCRSRNQSAVGVLKTCTSNSMLPAGGNNSQASTVTAPETAPNGSSNSDEFYKSCGYTYSCGNTITGIGYPFRDVDDPPYCGHPSFVLTCDSNNNVTNINIQNTKYRVLEIHQDTQLMTIVREDIMVESCPQQMVNTTLDNSLFDYASAYTNFTFLYGCPALNFSGLSPVSCWNDGYNGGYNDIYVWHGNKGPGMCNASVIVPAVINGNGEEKYGNLTGLDQVLRQGFEIRWKLDSKACSDCTESKGNCGFNFANNQTACICPDPPYIADTCSMINGASPAIKPESPRNGSNTKGLSIGLPIAGAVLAGVGLGWLIFYCKQRTKKRIAAKSVENGSKEITTPPSSKGLSTPRSTYFTKSIPSYPSSKSDFGRGSSYFGVHVFDYTELEEATNNFDPSKELGDGGFGTVYYGVLADGRVVAVKRLYENNVKRVEQFMNEVEILTRLRHKNLVMLYGCTSKRSRELLLVYEYIPNGTVADHLHGKRAKSGLLSWPVRLNIAIETAEALAYLHNSDIIHRDVKTNNVLLDNDFHVKVADFGLSRLFPTDVTHVSTAPQGTPGYVDPEYYQCYQLTEKSDVYSFGVMLIELISSLQAVDTSRHRHDINLANMAINKIQNRALHELVDSSLGFEKNNTVRRMVTLVAELAFRCLQQERDMRPSMEDVLEALKGIQNEDLNAHKVEIVDILVDEDARLPKGSIDTLSPDSVVPNNWGSNSTPNSSG